VHVVLSSLRGDYLPVYPARSRYYSHGTVNQYRSCEHMSDVSFGRLIDAYRLQHQPLAVLARHSSFFTTHSISGQIVKERPQHCFAITSEQLHYESTLVFAITILWGSILLRLGCINSMSHDRDSFKEAKPAIVYPLAVTWASPRSSQSCRHGTRIPPRCGAVRAT
jgi:hypothetical protein